MERYVVMNSHGAIEMNFKGQIITYTKEKAEEWQKYMTEKNKIKGWGLTFEVVEVLLEDKWKWKFI